jgi:hypothetical protein
MLQFENGCLIISIDVDVGSSELGLLNKGQNDRNVNKTYSEYQIGKIEEQVLPLLVNLFEDFEVPATFAIRGQLLEINHTLLEFLRGSSEHHDIGVHGYSHKSFDRLSEVEAEEEMKRTIAEMKKFNISPKSFVFPRNHIAHLDLLAKHGIKCYRGAEGLSMRIEKRGSLFNISPSLYLCEGVSSYVIEKTIDISIARKLPFHVWFHLWNFGQEEGLIRQNVERLLVPILKYSKAKEKNGLPTVDTMVSAAEKAEKLLKF